VEKYDPLPLRNIRRDVDINLIIHVIPIRTTVLLLFFSVAVLCPFAFGHWDRKIRGTVPVEVDKMCGLKSSCHLIEHGLFIRGLPVSYDGIGNDEVQVPMSDFLGCLGRHVDMLV
jgi:hypothetical protein